MDSSGLRFTGGALHDTDLLSPRPGSRRQASGLLENGDDWRPYLGLGWDRAVGNRNQLDIRLDLGVIFDSVDPSKTATQRDAHLIGRQGFLRDEFKSLRYKPAISADLEYRF